MKLIRVTLQGTPCVSLEHIVPPDYLEHLRVYEMDFTGSSTAPLNEAELALLYLLRKGVLNVTVEPFTFSGDES